MKTVEKSDSEILVQLTKIANKIDSKSENYFLSYPHFVNYFRELESINLENIIIGISFVYSWMPTILKSIKIENEKVVLSILNEAKNGIIPNEEQLEILKKSFNNSLVGTSKLLHFINPNKFAIWDSKVFRFLYNEEPHKYKLEKPKVYLKYLKFIENLKNEKSFDSFYILMKQKIGYEITECRALELAFFKGE